MRTGIERVKLAMGLYIVPMLLAYTPFLSGVGGAALVIFGFAVFGIYGLAGALQGCLERRLNWPMRGFAAVAGLACLWPEAVFVNIAGVAGVMALFALSLRIGHASPSVASVDRA